MMPPDRASGQAHFRSILTMVVGQAYQAAGYDLEHAPIQWVGGKYRFLKKADNATLTMDYQVLIYTANEYVAGMPSRFRVMLTRTTNDKAPITRSLNALVVSDFGVAILPEADYWWQFTDTTSLGKALAEAGHLAIGYAIPWLDGTLIPPNH